MDRSGWDATSWVDQELAGSTFKDERLGRRLRKLLVQMAGAVGAPIPLACQDWANTKAAYRFLSNEAVSEAEILAGHFHSTRSRVAADERGQDRRDGGRGHGSSRRGRARRRAPRYRPQPPPPAHEPLLNATEPAEAVVSALVVSACHGDFPGKPGCRS